MEDGKLYPMGKWSVFLPSLGRPDLMRNAMIGIYWAWVQYFFLENYWYTLGATAAFELFGIAFIYLIYEPKPTTTRAALLFGTLVVTMFLAPLAGVFSAYVLDVAGVRGELWPVGYGVLGLVVVCARLVPRVRYRTLIMLFAHVLLFWIFEMTHLYDFEAQVYISVGAIGLATLVLCHSFDAIPDYADLVWLLLAWVPVTLAVIGFAFTAIGGVSDRSFSSFI